MKYSFNLKVDRANMAFAQRYDLNVSYKDLGAVCDAVRYLKAGTALKLVEKIANKEMPIPFRRHNKHMGARSELHGRKGAYPIKAAAEVKVVLQNAIANALNNAMDGEEMIVVHACANKTHIERRSPSKGGLAWGRGMYGRSAMMHSDIEYSKIEIALAQPDEKGVTDNMKYFIGRKGSLERILKHKGDRQQQAAPAKKTGKKEEKKPEKKTEGTALPAPKKETPAKPKPKAEGAKPKAEVTKTEDKTAAQSTAASTGQDTK